MNPALQAIFFGSLAAVLGLYLGTLFPKPSSKGRAWTFFILGAIWSIWMIFVIVNDFGQYMENVRLGWGGRFLRNAAVHTGVFFKNLVGNLASLMTGGFLKWRNARVVSVTLAPLVWPLHGSDIGAMISLAVGFAFMGHAAAFLDDSTSSDKSSNQSG